MRAGVLRIVDDETGDVRIRFLTRHGDHDQSDHGNRDGGDFSERVAGASSGQDALDAAPAGRADGESRGLTEVQAEACDRYESFFGYRAMNGGLRGGGELDPETAGHVRNLDSAMGSSRLTDDAVVYRGMRDGEVIFGDRFNGDDMTGSEWTDPAFLSTSASGTSAENYSRHGLSSDSDPLNPVVMQMVVPEGTGAIQLNGLEDSAELVLERGLSLRVAGDHGVVDGIRRLDVEVVR